MEGRVRAQVALLALVFAAVVATLFASPASAGLDKNELKAWVFGDEISSLAMAVNDEGLPRFVYLSVDPRFDDTENWMRLLICRDEACRNSNNQPLLRTSASVTWLDIEIDPDGNPVIVYVEGTDIRLVTCDEFACINNGDPNVRIASDPSLIGFPSLALNADGFATVTYLGANGNVNVIGCTNKACTERVGPIAPFPGRSSQTVPDVAIDPNGNAVFTFTPRDANTWVGFCDSNACDGSVTRAVADQAIAHGTINLHDLNDGTYDVRVGGGVLFRDLVENTLSISSCNSASCASLREEWRNDELAHPAFLSNMAWTEETGPVFGYWTGSEEPQVHLASVDTSAEGMAIRNGNRVVPLSESWEGGRGFPNVEIDSNGRLWAVYVTADQLRIAFCDDAACTSTCNGRPATLDIRTGQDPVYNDVVVGTQFNDDIRGGQIVCAFGGNDRIIASPNASVFGGDGLDTIILSSGKNFASGGPGPDVITGGSGRDRLFGGPGNDTIDGRGASDRISGGDGHDELLGGWGDDQIFGRLGRDTIDGGPGDDIIKGGAWKDTIDGGEGDDDRCGIVAGEVRINCERGVFGI